MVDVLVDRLIPFGQGRALSAVISTPKRFGLIT
jgi:hypothetical protein